MPASLRAFCFLLCFALLLSVYPLRVGAYSILPSVSAESAVLTDGEGRILFEKNARTRMSMASTTKIMTAVVALEILDPEDTVSVDPRAVGVEGSSTYLKAGEKLTVSDLLYCLMLASANDAAAAIAYACAGSIEEFSALMNNKAESLGLFDTHFENPHGLDSKGHYTTALDLALLASFALKNAEFAKIVSTNSHIAKSDAADHSLFNHNRLLRSYKGCIGVKTGFTKSSGRCLVSAAERNGLRLICVTLRAPDDWNDHKELLDYGFEHFFAKRLCDIGQSFYDIPVVSGEAGRVSCVASSRKLITCLNGEDEKISFTVECPRFLWKLPRPGERLGRVLFYKDGKLIAESELIAHIII